MSDQTLAEELAETATAELDHRVSGRLGFSLTFEERKELRTAITAMLAIAIKAGREEE